MDILMVFLPDNLIGNRGYLRGIYDPPGKGKDCGAVYVLGSTPDTSDSHILGSKDDGTLNWLGMDVHDDGERVVRKVRVDGKMQSLDKCHFIEYDKEAFTKTELMRPGNDEPDYFKTLSGYLKAEDDNLSYNEKRSFILGFFVTILHFIMKGFDKVDFIIQHSAIGNHIKERTKNLIWFLNSFAEKKHYLQVSNFFIALLFDALAGLVITHLLTKFNEQEILQFISLKTEQVLEFIQHIIKWLMGSPGGLKLNYPLNYILGNFFLYNIHLWWTFLGMIRPVLEVGFSIFLKLGFLGLSFQLAIVADIFSMVSFHVYCIYVYAAKLFEYQTRGIYSLSNIFFGRKRNPEPGKVDSCPYSIEQLFIGTICFTVLLFLLPTTFMYYAVFMLIRLIAIMVGGILTRARYLLEILPVYSTLVWLFRPSLVINAVHLTPVRGFSKKGLVTIKTRPIAASWVTTMKTCISNTIIKPKSIDWKLIGKNILVGKLLYPM